MDVRDLMERALAVDAAEAAAQAAKVEGVRHRQAAALASLLGEEVWQALHMDPLVARLVEPRQDAVEIDGWVLLDDERVPCKITLHGVIEIEMRLRLPGGRSVKERLSEGSVSVGRALNQAREIMAELRQKELDWAENVLRNYRIGAEEAARAAEVLMRWRPEAAAEWQALLDAQLERLAADVDFVARESELRRVRDEERQAFAEVCAAWRNQCEQVASANDRWTAAMQERADQPFSAVQLVYGVVASEVGDDPYLETRSMWVHAWPEAWFRGGCWVQVYRGVGLALTRRYVVHPVYCETVQLRPSARQVYAAVRRHGCVLLVGPETPEQVVEEWSAGVAAPPEAPQPPSWMGDWEVDWIRSGER